MKNVHSTSVCGTCVHITRTDFRFKTGLKIFFYFYLSTVLFISISTKGHSHRYLVLFFSLS